jgi:AcrR family transcriptional regulator
VSKGEITKQAILEHAMGLASAVGLEGLTIGRLADDLQLSKSGLFAHFKSKDALQLQIVEHAAAQFTELVVKPALKAPRGEARVRAVFENWIRWPERSALAGGCFFVAAATELDDRPGPARDLLVQHQKDWLDIIANVVRTAISEGQLKKGVDPEQVAFEMYGLMLVCHQYTRLLGDKRAVTRARSAFEALIARARA